MSDDTISRRAVIDELNKRQRMLIYCFGFENDMVKIIDIAKKNCNRHAVCTDIAEEGALGAAQE